MLRSLFTAVTGVRAHQTMLDVTGNNISNANTTGFKKDNTIFADLMYQANKYASGAGDTRGGINPAQVGLGVSVSAIETIHTQGSGQYTGNPSDMMIQDKGFFVYQNGNQQIYSRSGACVLDGNSDMVLSGQGYKLQGYKYEDTPLDGYQQAASLSTVNIPLGQKIDAKATTRVDYQCNLDSRSNAYLPYGFADLPFNTNASWRGSTTGRAAVTMNGTEYELAFTTDFNALANADGSGINYFTVSMQNAGELTNLTFDMTGINGETGLPRLSLPKLNAQYDEEGNISGYISSLTAGEDDEETAATGLVSNANFVGWLNDSLGFVENIEGITEGTTQSTLDTYMPIYKFPGSTPPKYFAVEYNDTTGTMKIRSLSFFDAEGNDITNQSTTAGLSADLQSDDALAGATIKPNPTVFTYSIKDNMNYSNFRLSGAPTIATADNAEGEPLNVAYDFIAEFDESVDRASGINSDMSTSASKMTLWYYGWSNADWAASLAGDGENLGPRVHKLEATVYFKADGTFDAVSWEDINNDNAPRGYRIVAGSVPYGAEGDDAAAVGPNFQISVGSSSAASTKADTLNFLQAKSLDIPGDVSSTGEWSNVGATYQGGYHATKMTIYDDNGKDHTLEVTFKKLTENRWRWEAFLVEKDDSGQDTLVNIIPEPHAGEIEFDGSGRISNAVTSENQRRGTDDAHPNAEVEIAVPFSLNGQPNSVITLNFGGGVGSGGSALDGVTQFASETTTKPIYQNGYTMGVLKNYSIAIDGVITGSYDNGINLPLYRVALATFANEQGLEKIGNTMFQATVNSGNANIDGATTNGKGSIMSQYLEMSNVDLTEEFTHLIIAQRGFQANTRVVTVSDQILEEVVNLKR